MAKRPSLTESMKSVQRAPSIAREAPESSAEPSRAERPAAKGYFAATRQGVKRITFGASQEDHRRLKRLSADTDMSIEALMSEALADLFAKRG